MLGTQSLAELLTLATTSLEPLLTSATGLKDVPMTSQGWLATAGPKLQTSHRYMRIGSAMEETGTP